MATATISSMLLSSDDPTRLRDWYATAFEATVSATSDDPDDPGYHVIDLDGFYIMFDRRDDVAGPNAEGARVILNLDVDDPQATAARLDELGAEWVSRLEERDGNWFGTAKDPDGNWLQIIRLSDETEAQMSGEPTRPFSGFAVRDIDTTEAFYRDVLGMRVLRGPMGILDIRINRNTTVIAYPKPDHEPAGYTILNIPVGDVGTAVTDLTGRGVEFLRYEGFDQDEHGVMRGNGPDIAWFTDPSGNVLSVLKG